MEELLEEDDEREDDAVLLEGDDRLRERFMLLFISAERTVLLFL